jgi:hypothetical protein
VTNNNFPKLWRVHRLAYSSNHCQRFVVVAFNKESDHSLESPMNRFQPMRNELVNRVVVHQVMFGTVLSNVVKCQAQMNGTQSCALDVRRNEFRTAGGLNKNVRPISWIRADSPHPFARTGAQNPSSFPKRSVTESAIAEHNDTEYLVRHVKR